jgi:hypothetical protein
MKLDEQEGSTTKPFQIRSLLWFDCAALTRWLDDASPVAA